MANELDELEELESERLVLADLINHVLDKGVVVSGTVTVSIADIDLLVVDLRLVLTSIERSLQHGIGMAVDQLASAPDRSGGST